jgi:hypothetical protein
MYNGITRLRLSTVDGSVAEGSSDPISARAEEGTSAFGYTEGELVGVHPYSSMADFVKDCRDQRYQSDPLDPRPAEEFRELCSKRLAKYEMLKAEAAVPEADDASQISALDPSIPPIVAKAGVQAGGFATREMRQEAYADPRYKVSEDYRAFVAARDALTEDFGA